MHSQCIVNTVIKVWRKEAKKKEKLSKSPRPNHTVKSNYTRGLNLKIELMGSLFQKGQERTWAFWNSPALGLDASLLGNHPGEHFGLLCFITHKCLRGREP